MIRTPLSSNTLRTELLAFLCVSRFKKNLLLFSPFSYQVAFDRIIAPFFYLIYTYLETYHCRVAVVGGHGETYMGTGTLMVVGVAVVRKSRETCT